MEKVIKERFWVVEHKESECYLRLEYIDGAPSFTSNPGLASHYDSLEHAKLAVKRIKGHGYTMTLKPQSLDITYRVGV